jgi:hypothetical protein
VIDEDSVAFVDAGELQADEVERAAEQLLETPHRAVWSSAM